MTEHREFDLANTYIQLHDGPKASPIAVGPDFWPQIANRVDLSAGRLVTMFRQKRGPWNNAEMHPAGDEILFLVSGEIELILESSEGERRIAFHGGNAVIVPQGVWHSANVIAEGNLLAITRGAGTQHRARK
jgi:mannose-6-phosphate isomerase-like protein (cupin superfamily)